MNRNDERDPYDFGTPNHLGYLKMSDNDSRRDKRRCMHYTQRNGTCNCPRELCYKKICLGSSHCSSYEEDRGRTVAANRFGSQPISGRTRRKKGKNYVPIYEFHSTTDTLKAKVSEFSNGTEVDEADDRDQIKREYLLAEESSGKICRYRIMDSGICNAPGCRNYRRICGGVAGCPNYRDKPEALEERTSSTISVQSTEANEGQEDNTQSETAVDIWIKQMIRDGKSEDEILFELGKALFDKCKRNISEQEKVFNDHERQYGIMIRKGDFAGAKTLIDRDRKRLENATNKLQENRKYLMQLSRSINSTSVYVDGIDELRKMVREVLRDIPER